MASETGKLGGTSVGGDENRGRDDTRKADKKTRGMSKDLVASLDKRVEDVETSMAEFKDGMEEFKAEFDIFKTHTYDSLQQVDALGNDFLDMRNDLKLALSVMKKEIEEAFMKELGHIKEKYEREIKDLQTELNVCKRALASGGDNIIHTSSKVDIPKPSSFVGKREARAVDDFLWEMKQYFEAVDIVDDAKKIKTVTLYLKYTAAL